MSACPACGATWSCGGGCPIWGYGGSGWKRTSDDKKQERVAIVNDAIAKGELLVSDDTLETKVHMYPAADVTFEIVVDDGPIRGYDGRWLTVWIDEPRRPLTGRQRTRARWRRRGRR